MHQIHSDLTIWLCDSIKFTLQKAMVHGLAKLENLLSVLNCSSDILALGIDWS